MKRIYLICLAGVASLGVLGGCSEKPDVVQPVAASALPIAERAGSVVWDGSNFTVGGKPLKTAKLWTFNGSAEGFTAPASRLAPAVGGGLSMVISDPTLRSPKGLEIQGRDYPTVLVRLTRTAQGDIWDGALYYSTLPNGAQPMHGEAAEFLGKPIQGAYPKLGETTTLVYDMRKQVTGGDDWTKARIDQIRIDVEDVAGGAFIIHQIAVAEPVDPALIPADPKDVVKKARAEAAAAAKS